MHNTAKFTLKDMTECGAALRQMGSGAHSMEEPANKIVRYLYEHLIENPSGEKSCALVRFFKIHPWDNLKTDLQQFACNAMLDVAGDGRRSARME